MSAAVIEARGLTKTFSGGIVAVKDLHLAVERGAVYGMIGRNGSGKSTTLRLLLGLLQPDQGSASILGHDFWRAPHSARERAAYVSQSQRLPGGLTLEDLCRCQQRFNRRWDPDHARSLAKRWELPWKRPVGSLSDGEQRKAALLTAFAGRPEVLVLDEPAAGFDPVARRELVDQILEALTQGDGCTVLLSTHLIGDLERMADHIGILDRGRVALSARLEDLLNETRRVQVIFDAEEAPAHFAIPGALRVHRTGAVLNAIVRWTSENELDALRASTGARIQVFPINLEEIFMELFGNRNDADGVQETTPLLHATF
jgi:ABC-type multidrug transport system ATPase subunit